MADAKGSGIPLAFLLVSTSKDAGPGAKQAVLEHFLTALKKQGVSPEFTLSDKDWSEINAMRAVWPQSKHQLCFWHALRALKQRLSKTKDSPAPYDPNEPRSELEFIRADFVPEAQLPLTQEVSHSIYQAFAHGLLNLHLNIDQAPS